MLRRSILFTAVYPNPPDSPLVEETFWRRDLTASAFLTPSREIGEPGPLRPPSRIGFVYPDVNERLTTTDGAQVLLSQHRVGLIRIPTNSVHECLEADAHIAEGNPHLTLTLMERMEIITGCADAGHQAPPEQAPSRPQCRLTTHACRAITVSVRLARTLG